MGLSEGWPRRSIKFRASHTEDCKTAAAIGSAGGSGAAIAATEIGTTNAGNLQIAFGQNGVLYGEDTNGQIYTINLVTGAATIVPGSTPTGNGVGDLASVPLFADLTVTQTASVLSKGKDATYAITVADNGSNANVSEVVVTDTLPAGVSFVSAAGTGWTLNSLGQVITMTYTGNVPVGTTLPIVTLTVAVGDSVPASVVNTVIVSSKIFDQDAAGSSSTLSSAID